MSYIRIWVHIVWSVKYRRPVFDEILCAKLCRHISDYCRSKKIYLNMIGGNRDHFHALISLHPTQSISTVVNQIKGESSHWMNTMEYLPSHFEWQDEYSAISVSESAVEEIRRYIASQRKHHEGE